MGAGWLLSPSTPKSLFGIDFSPVADAIQPVARKVRVAGAEVSKFARDEVVSTASKVDSIKSAAAPSLNVDWAALQQQLSAAGASVLKQGASVLQQGNELIHSASGVKQQSGGGAAVADKPKGTVLKEAEQKEKPKGTASQPEKPREEPKAAVVEQPKMEKEDRSAEQSDAEQQLEEKPKPAPSKQPEPAAKEPKAAAGGQSGAAVKEQRGGNGEQSQPPQNKAAPREERTYVDQSGAAEAAMRQQLQQLQPREQPKAQPKPEAKAPPKEQPKPQPQPEARAQPKEQPKAEPKPQPKEFSVPPAGAEGQRGSAPGGATGTMTAPSQPGVAMTQPQPWVVIVSEEDGLKYCKRYMEQGCNECKDPTTCSSPDNECAWRNLAKLQCEKEMNWPNMWKK